MEILDDNQIVEQLKQGVQEAFKYFKIPQAAHCISFYILVDEMEAEDTVQKPVCFSIFWEKSIKIIFIKRLFKTAIRKYVFKKGLERERRSKKEIIDYQYTLTE